MASSTLAPAELLKYPYRVEKFLEKYSKGEEFELTNGSFTKLNYCSNIVEWIKTDSRCNLIKKIFTDCNGNNLALSDLKKTSEFGGKGVGYSIRKETSAIDSFNKQIQEIKCETLRLNIPLKISNNSYSVSICSKVNGTPKADFQLSDANGKELVWISHKDGKRPTDFLHYGGMSEETIKDHSEIKSFVATIRNLFPNGLTPKTYISRKIKDNILKKRSVYGIGYNKIPFGEQNVTCLIQGDIKLERSDNYFSINSNFIHPNGEDLTGAYEPILGSSYRTDRNQFGITNCRFLIMPLEAKTVKQFL